MAGGYPNRGALGVPIGDRSPGASRPPAPQAAAGGAPSRPGAPPTSTRATTSVPPRRRPFVLVGAEGAPGLVVEQRRTESGWQVLVALVDTTSDGGSGLVVRWFDASCLRPADTSSGVDTAGEPAHAADGTSRPPGAARGRRS